MAHHSSMPATYVELLFTEDEFKAAADRWGCNCGPSALAACLGWNLNEVRELLDEVGFEPRGYMSPTMMKDALRLAGRQYCERTRSRRIMPDMLPGPFPDCGLVRVQWTGPWTQPGANARWAYNYTHWIASFNLRDGLGVYVFDCNGGMRSYERWRDEIAPILANVPRGDGGWFATHLWEVR